MTNKQKAEEELQRIEAIESLRRMIPVNSTVYTVLTHVSRSGMMRHIKVLIADEGKIKDVSWYAARALNWPQADSGAVKVGGCGMDMGFHLVYTLARVLFATDENNADAGYSLNQSWL